MQENHIASLLPRVVVHPGGRSLATSDSHPFLWLGDTAWELFHRLTLEEATEYFANRAEKGFTVIQAVALAEFDGLHTPNRYGELPLLDDNPCQPNPEYFNRVDSFLRLAATNGLYVGLLPTWGDKVTRMWGIGPQVFTVENAFCYGAWLGKRFRGHTNLIWIMGGDRPAEHEGVDYRPVWRAMARGIREGVDAPLFMTYHPMGGHSSSAWLQGEDWLDGHMLQSGHGGGHDAPTWEMIERDYDLWPPRPVLDAEPNYEDHPVNPWPVWNPANGYYRDHDVRKQLYRSVFAGGCGVTYGHHAIWQFFTPEREPVNFPDRDWRAALDRSGANAVRHFRDLIESWSFFERIPDQHLLAGGAGAGGDHRRAARSPNGCLAMIYLPEAKPVTVRFDMLHKSVDCAQWYDPRTGAWSEASGQPAGDGMRMFTPPQEGPDWVLVLGTTPESAIPDENTG